MAGTRTGMTRRRVIVNGRWYKANMPRFKLLIEYDGTPFVGWQLQAGGPSVQGLIAEAIAAFCGERVAVYRARRTDARVHALRQVAPFDLSRDWPPHRGRD